MDAAKKTSKKSEATEPKTTTDTSRKKGVKVNDFSVQEVITRVRVLVDEAEKKNARLPVQQALVSVLNWNWTYEFQKMEDEGMGTLVILSDEKEPVASYSYPGSYQEALKGAFCLAFGYSFPQGAARSESAASKAQAQEIVSEETTPEDELPFLDDDPILSDSEVVSTKPRTIRGKVQSGKSDRGFYNDPNGLPDRFSARVTLLSDMEQYPKQGKAKGYGAYVTCRNAKLAMRYWIDNCEEQIRPQYLSKLSKGDELAGVFTKYVNPTSGEVQLCLQGFANAVC